MREAIPNLRFSPADVGGKKVKQLVEMPFTFSLNKDAADGSNTTVDFSVRQMQPRKVEATVGSVSSNGPRPTLPKDVYFDYQVERPASPLTGQHVAALSN